MCREYALEQGYTVVAELQEDDRGASGASFELPQLNYALEMAQRDESDVFVVRELDWLSRKLAKQLIVEETFGRYNVEVEYVLAAYDDTPEGRLQKHIRATVAEYEREKIAERMVRGRRNKVKAGHVMVQKRPPYGYRTSEDGTTLVVYEAEAQIIRLIFQWYIEGDENGNLLSTYDIADKLTQMQVPTWGDIHRRNKTTASAKKRGFGKWAATTISKILKNSTYAGSWTYGKRGVHGVRNPASSFISVEVPQIISPATWKKAQAQLKTNTITAKRNVGNNRYLMRFRLRCGCGYCYKRTGRSLTGCLTCTLTASRIKKPTLQRKYS